MHEGQAQCQRWGSGVTTKAWISSPFAPQTLHWRVRAVRRVRHNSKPLTPPTHSQYSAEFALQAEPVALWWYMLITSYSVSCRAARYGGDSSGNDETQLSYGLSKAVTSGEATRSAMCGFLPWVGIHTREQQQQITWDRKAMITRLAVSHSACSFTNEHSVGWKLPDATAHFTSASLGYWGKRRDRSSVFVSRRRSSDWSQYYCTCLLIRVAVFFCSVYVAVAKGLYNRSLYYCLCTLHWNRNLFKWRSAWFNLSPLTRLGDV